MEILRSTSKHLRSYIYQVSSENFLFYYKLIWQNQYISYLTNAYIWYISIQLMPVYKLLLQNQDFEAKYTD